MTDFTKLRAQAMNHGEDEEAVTVNTRALIDKVLARYSGEWTTLRELLQNAADAQATTVKIKFETLPSTTIPLPSNASQSELLKHTLLHATLRRLLVSNDGLVFGEADWSRLKRIAEGNPNEEKIGAFGVGFYSVFADCEEPFVSSGKKAMAFYWKKDSLFTKQIQVEDGTNDTSFVLDYRNSTTPVPSLVSLSQFLATSLTFVALQNIELWIDDWKIISLKKTTSPSSNVAIPRDITTTTKEGMMNVMGLARESVQMRADFMSIVGWRPSSNSAPKSSSFGETIYGRSGSETPSLRSFFSRLTAPASRSSRTSTSEDRTMQEVALEDLTLTSTSNVFLSVTTASISCKVKKVFAAELERATKKAPPQTTRLALLTSSYDEVAASTDGGKNAALIKRVNIFGSVLPGKEKGGRIFIGFPTNQTTGAGLHLSAPSLIPTVEREAIDLNARWVRTWNMEMLRVAGIISRIAYGNEMADLGRRLQRFMETENRVGTFTKEDIQKFCPEALHILKSFTFDESTPNAQISQIIEESFWTSYQQASIEMYSSRGVLPTTTVRLATEDLSGFVDGIPVLPEPLVDSTLVRKLKDYGLITEITVEDVKKELGAKALTKDQLMAFILWAGKKAITREIPIPTMNGLLDSAVATIGESQGGIVTLSSIKYFLQPKSIPADVPIPPEALPFEVTQKSTYVELQALGWEPLDAVTWVRFLAGSVGGRNGLTTEQDITLTPRFAGHVLSILSKQWDSLHPQSKQIVIGLLKPLTVIPTKVGMRKPTESYFQSVKLFDDLPTIAVAGVKEKFLGALGVRKTVDLETIFQRLLSPSSDTDMSSASKWNHVDLVVYLAGVRDDIPNEDMKKLREMAICAAEAGPLMQEASVGSAKRYKISELFEPKNDLRSLGLPIIQWTGKGGYKPTSPEGKFLTTLGLRSFPSPPELVKMMVSQDTDQRVRALNYFIKNYEINGYAQYSLAGATTPFLPIEGDTKALCTPSTCFSNEKSTLVGMRLLRRDLVPHAAKFGVAENPPLPVAVHHLLHHAPKTQKDARVLFGYFSSRIGEKEFSSVINKLSDALIVPVATKTRLPGFMFPEKSESGIKHVAPNQVFIGNSDLYREIFDFVDFGEDANRFLLAVGSNHEPSVRQIALQLASEPARILGIVKSPEKYIALLHLLALSQSDLKRDTRLWSLLQSAPFLLSTKEVTAAQDKTLMDQDAEEEDEDGTVKRFQLQSARNIVIVDDYATYRLFKNDLFAAPLEETLEDFYIALGSQPISKLERQNTTIGHPLPGCEKENATIQKLILERSKVFLHSYAPDQLKHGKGWLESNLSVEYVQSITTRISLHGYERLSRKLKQTAIMEKNSGYGGKYILRITQGVDYYDISQAIVRHLLKRPNNEASTLFESLLTSDLQGLKRRGFNVDRIMRARAAEARIAEDARLKQLQLEQEQITKKQEEFKNNQMVVANGKHSLEQDRSNDMPGAFGADSPPAQKPKRGLFSQIKQNFGFGDSAQEHLQNFLGGHGSGQQQKALDAPPPGYDTNGQKQITNSNVRAPGEAESVSSPAAVQQNLLNAIKASRAHDSGGVFSPPTRNNIKEESTYCDVMPGQNMQYIGATSSGMRIYGSRDLTLSPEEFLSRNIKALNAFAKLLWDVAAIYGIPRDAMNITYDESGGTIAFNLQGSYFCNLRFFLQLHWEKAKYSAAESWWWVVVAHELAHNLVKEHNAEHSYYT